MTVLPGGIPVDVDAEELDDDPLKYTRMWPTLVKIEAAMSSEDELQEAFEEAKKEAPSDDVETDAGGGVLRSLRRWLS